MGRRRSDGKDEQPIELGGINGGFYSSIDESLKAIEKAGGKVVTPKHSIGEWGFIADFADPEGNIIALWEKPVR